MDERMDIINKSDLMIFGSTKVLRLEQEVKSLHATVRWLTIGLITIGIIGILFIWIMLFAGYKAGYNEAIRDFQTGKLKIEIIKK